MESKLYSHRSVGFLAASPAFKGPDFYSSPLFSRELARLKSNPDQYCWTVFPPPFVSITRDGYSSAAMPQPKDIHFFSLLEYGIKDSCDDERALIDGIITCIGFIMKVNKCVHRFEMTPSCY